jgi:predicted ribosome quality control (RQC) complex YloA/Tae2 family protein
MTSICNIFYHISRNSRNVFAELHMQLNNCNLSEINFHNREVGLYINQNRTSQAICYHHTVVSLTYPRVFPG